MRIINLNMILKVKAAAKGKANDKMEKMNGTLRWGFGQREHYNQYFANECKKYILSLNDKRLFLETKRPKQTTWRNVYSRIKKNVMIQPAVQNKILFKKWHLLTTSFILFVIKSESK